MITFKNGHRLTFACASGALAFDGKGWWFEQPFRWLGLLNPKAFTVVAKTVTLQPLQGNYRTFSPWTCIRFLRRNGRKGLVNAVGLTNPGIDQWIARDYPEAKRRGYTLSASLQLEQEDAAFWMGHLLNPLDLAYVEVNGSCPNVAPHAEFLGSLRELRKVCHHPLVLKLSLDQVNESFVKDTEPFVDAYHALNSVPWNTVFLETPSPLEQYPHKKKGGVSGEFIREVALRSVGTLKRWSCKPVLGGGGIFCLQDVLAFEQAGADAFSLGTCFTFFPWRPNQILRQYEISRSGTTLRDKRVS